MDAERDNNSLHSKDSGPATPVRRVRSDLTIAALAGLAGAVVLFACWQAVGVQSDESVGIYGALRMLDGESIYRDFWTYHTPGIYFLTAAIFKVLGESLLAVRMVLILAASASASGLYMLGRKFLPPLTALLPPVLFIMIGVNLWTIGGYNWYSTFLLVFSTLFTARFLEDRTRAKSLFVGGFLAGVTFLFQQPKGGYLLVLVFVFLLFDEFLQENKATPPQRARNMVRTGAVFTAGGTAAIFLVAAYFILSGTFVEAVSATIGYPLKLLSQAGGEEGYAGFYGSMTASTLSSLSAMAPLPLKGTSAAVVATFLLNFAAPLSIFVAAGIWLIRRWKGKEKNAVPMLCSAAALAAYGSALQRPDFFHLLTIAPACYLSLAYVIHSIMPTPECGKFSPARKAAGLIVAAILVLSCGRIAVGHQAYASRLQAISLGSPLGFAVAPKKGSGSGSGGPLMSVIDYIQFNTDPDDSIFAVSYSPFIYYLSGRKNPTPYIDVPSSPCMDASFHVFKLGHASFNLDRLENTARALEAAKTRIVILDPAAACQVRAGWDESAVEDEPLISYIKKNYSIEADLGVYVIMVRSG